MSFHYIIYSIYRIYDFSCLHGIRLETMYHFSHELSKGYFKETKFHNSLHIIDSLQAMHYILSTGGLKSQISNIGIFSVFISNMIHDYEHPGFSNQFVVRTKHPLAIRYSDHSVLENHSLAAAFQLIYKKKDCNILENLTIDNQRMCRRLIIEIVLNTELSRHFSLITTLKTKLGNSFPTEDIEDIILILSMTLRICDNFKVVRDGRNVFNKWMDYMFDEYYRQGDIEKQLDIPISKFMDRSSCNKSKAYLNYINVVCMPLFSTFMILI